MEKLCYIATVPLTIETFVLDIVKYLHQTGEYDISIICAPDEKFGKSLPPYIHYIPVHMKRGISLSGIKAVRQLYKIFKKEKFDYIQYSTPNASFYASIASFLAKAPIRLYAQWGIRYVGAHGTGRMILKLLEKITCMLSTDIRAVSKKNMQFAIDEGLYKAIKARVIGDGGTIGVDLENFDLNKKSEYRQAAREKYGIDDEEFVFGFIGRFSRDKGSNELLGAVKSLCDKGKNIRLAAVGRTEAAAGMDEELMQWAKDSDRVIFIDEVPKQEIHKYYAMFDCYVHPTYREGFGMVLQEAAAMENAIITTDIPGASEVMEADVSCKLVPAGDSQALQNMMLWMLENRDCATELGKAARKRTEQHFERSIMLENIKNDLEATLS